MPDGDPAATAFRAKVNAFLGAVGEEFRFALLLDQIEQWASLGASDEMLRTLGTVTGMPATSGG